MKSPAWMAVVLAAVLLFFQCPTNAQNAYPSSPVTLVVGFAPGGGADLIARILAQKLTAQLSTSVIVENKAGANSNIGAEFVARSKPDGYTLLLSNPSQILSPAFGEKLGYELLKDLTPVARITSSPMVLVVHPAIPANNAAEFIALLKANPDKFAYGSSGTGSIDHLSGLMFLQANGLAALHVPYKGVAPALLDLSAGRTQFEMLTVTSMLPMANEKRIKPLAVAALKRSPLLPDVPTLHETIMPGFEITQWFGIMVQGRTPPSIVKRLNDEIVKALQSADMKSRVEQQGAELAPSNPEQYGAYLRSELDRWTKVIKIAGVKLE